MAADRYHARVSLIHPLPSDLHRVEPWANGAGSTTVVFRDPDSEEWRVRISVAMVAHDGPFSELPETQRLLVPLDSPMTLHFPGGTAQSAKRFGVLRFDGAPAPSATLPEGATRDFNVMLRHGARADVHPRTLVDSMILPMAPLDRWLLYLDSGHASIAAGGAAPVALRPGDAALVEPDGGEGQVAVRGGGEILLARLYA